MERTKLAAIGKYVLRDRQHLGCLRVREGVISLEKMFFHDEIRPSGKLAPKTKVAKAELDNGNGPDRAVHGPFRAGALRGHLPRGALRDHQGEAGRRARRFTATPAEEEEEPTDLLAALKASVEAAKRSKSSARAKRPPARKRATRAKTKRY